MAVALSSLNNADLLARYNSVMAEAIRWNHQQPPTPASKAKASGLLATAKAIASEMQRRAKVGLGIIPAIVGTYDGTIKVITEKVTKTVDALGFGLVVVAGVLASVYLWQK